VESGTRIGTTVAGYRLEALLGRGGMSVVYLAEQVRLQRKVALKLLTPALSADEGFRERFETEAKRAAEVDHPNVIPVYDAGEADGELYIAMRFVQGGDLGSLIRPDRPLTLARTLFILEQAAGALDAAHARGLVHRDVKPANILVEESSERAFVTDFGIVKHPASTGLTKTGFFLGTVDYAAPEQIEGRPVDPRTDVYALGCVLYACLAGYPPFERETEVAVMHAHLTEPPPLVTKARPDLPAPLDGVIGRALAKSRDDRYGSCGELIAAARAAAGYGESPPAGAGGARFSKRWALAGAALALAAGIGVAVPLVLARDDGAATSAPPAPPLTVTVPVRDTVSEETATTQIEIAGTSGQAVSSEEASPAAGSGLAGLASVLPAELSEECALEDTPRPGALATASCLPPSAPPADRPDSWEISLFPDYKAADNRYGEILSGVSGSQFDAGSCTEITWSGEGEWRHPSGKVGGRNLCYLEADEAVVVWTHLRLTETGHGADHGNVLVIARAAAARQPALFAWWVAWRDTIGRTTEG
jgi:serine/threonine-protein kinase